MSIPTDELTAIAVPICDKMSITVNRKFSEWLNGAINDHGLTQSELARRSGLSRQAISDYINGKRNNPEPEALVNIARALHESPITVYIAAGLLPPIDPDDADIEVFREILRNLPPEERKELKQIGWLKVELKGNNVSATAKRKQSGK